MSILVYGATDGVYGVANCIRSVLVKPAHRRSDGERRETLALNLDAACVRRSAPERSDGDFTALWSPRGVVVTAIRGQVAW